MGDYPPKLSIEDIAISSFNGNLARTLRRFQEERRIGIAGHEDSEIIGALPSEENRNVLFAWLSLPTNLAEKDAFLKMIEGNRTDGRFSDAACIVTSNFREQWKIVRKKLAERGIILEAGMRRKTEEEEEEEEEED